MAGVMIASGGILARLSPPAGQKGGGCAVVVRSRLPVSLVALSAAAGVLVAAAAYTAGRFGYSASPWANRAYWLGQALILVPSAARLLSRRTVTAAGTATVVIVMTVAEYLVKICYSPVAFTFPDELEHWRGTTDILQTSALFTPNNLLPISSLYPGLEEVTSALSAITGLPVFISGLIVAGAAHLLFVCLLYLLFRHISGSTRLAGIAVLLYVGNSHFQSFDSMFAYQTLALAFLGLTLLAAWRLTAPEPSRKPVGWLTIALVGIFATVVTHHVTSYMLVATPVLITRVSGRVGHHRSAAWLAALAWLAAVSVVGWLMFVARPTVSYLQPVVGDMLQGLGSVFSSAQARATPLSGGPLGDWVLSAAAAGALSAMLPIGWWQVWRRYRREPWTVAMAVGSISWYVIVAVRLWAPDGSELAGRASTFVFIPAAYTAGLGVMYLAQTGRGWAARIAAAAALAGTLTLIFDGLANGWPPYWERLPGPYRVAAYERSVEPEELASASWALAALGPGNRFATDFGNYPLLGSYGDQNPVGDVDYLYTSPRFTPSDADMVREESIRYVLVDIRLSQQLPGEGGYFPNSGPVRYIHPIPAANLRKFDHVPGVNRLYDSGNIVIYGLEAVLNGAP
jgi:hypothetical protein